MIQDQLKFDLSQAVKAKDEFKSTLLRSLLSALSYYQIDKHGSLTDEDVILVFKKEAKKRREAIDLYQRGNRQDLVQKEQQELKTIEGYMPAEMSDENLEKIIKAEIEKLDQSGVIVNENIAMKTIMPLLKNKADGSRIRAVVIKLMQKN